jgi:rhodanese-related sulfurtransferase
MGLLGWFRQWLGKEKTSIDPPHPPRLEEAPRPENLEDKIDEALDEEIKVDEIEVEALAAALTHAGAPLVLDVREPYEWRQVRMPGAVHIPMHTVPEQLARLPKDRPIVVMCAHGNRSYGVAAWLLEQGYRAANLRGGITQWAVRGGPVEQGTPTPE